MKRNLYKERMIFMKKMNNVERAVCDKILNVIEEKREEESDRFLNLEDYLDSDQEAYTDGYRKALDDLKKYIVDLKLKPKD